MLMGQTKDDWLTADGLILLESWARDGWTIENIAARIGIAPQTFRAWMNKEEEIKRAVSNGRELVDYKVENALLKSALGYKTKEVKVIAKIKNGRVIEETKETINKELAPNVSACQVWLYNRKPKTWKNMNSRSNILDEIDGDTNVHITIERATTPQTNIEGSTSVSIDEADTDWQNDVNKSVTLRGMTEKEKQEAKRRNNSTLRKTEEDEEKFSEMLNGDDEYEDSYSVSKRHDDRSDNAHVQDTKEDSDRDYWPDDWEDDE